MTCPRCLSPVATYRLTTYAPGCGTPERETSLKLCACPPHEPVPQHMLAQPCRVGGREET